MKKTTLLLVVAFVLLIISCVSKEKNTHKIKVPDLSRYEFQQTKEVVQLVYDAVNEIELKGIEAFAQFRVEGSKWYHDDIYVFVWGIEGMRYVYPPNPALEGINMKDLKDVNGKPVGQEFIKAANLGEGWVSYMWTKPNETISSKKITFIKRAVDPDGNAYLVGCGLYDMPPEKVFAEGQN